MILGSVGFEIRVDPDRTARRALSVLRPFVETLEQRLVVSVRRAMARSYLRAFEVAFLERLHRALEMEVLGIGDGDGGIEEVGGPPQLQEKFPEQRRYLNALHRARRSADADEVTRVKARARLDVARADWYREARRLKDRTGYKAPSIISSGMFRLRASQLLESVADPNRLNVRLQGGSLRIGAGPFTKIDRIQTPSATPQQFGRETSSPYKLLWRHLELGTGRHADPRFARSDSWVYPIKMFEDPVDGFPVTIPLILGGTKPMHVLAAVAQRENDVRRTFVRILANELRR